MNEPRVAIRKIIKVEHDPHGSKDKLLLSCGHVRGPKLWSYKIGDECHCPTCYEEDQWVSRNVDL
jgi:hypothetical protein